MSIFHLNTSNKNKRDEEPLMTLFTISDRSLDCSLGLILFHNVWVMLLAPYYYLKDPTGVLAQKKSTNQMLVSPAQIFCHTFSGCWFQPIPPKKYWIIVNLGHHLKWRFPKSWGTPKSSESWMTMAYGDSPLKETPDRLGHRQLMATSALVLPGAHGFQGSPAESSRPTPTSLPM